MFEVSQAATNSGIHAINISNSIAHAGAAPDANARKGRVWGEGYHLRGQ